ncbi:MAG: DUF1732 domain-containing protein, partial [Methylobacteriaceae bacterium]|nr:DUF1732 domain-containing protein [Methylobacteriaceae bacterium]
DVVEADDDEATRAAARQAALEGLEAALDDLVAMRRQEGAALAAVLGQRLDRIAALTRAVDAHPARTPEAIRDRLAEQVHAIIATGAGLDPTRLHQEAVMLATRADVREELDRLVAHVGAARDLLAGGGAVGRRLDFLAQEFGREASTLCAKANHPALTALGMELRAEVEQLREQAQNIE